MDSKRELFIHRTIDNLKAMWMLNSSAEFSEVLTMIVDIDNLDFSDEDFSDKLKFELEQIQEA